MAELTPFRALRRSDKAQQGSFDFTLFGNPSGANTADDLNEWIDIGALKQDTDPGFYIYEQEFTYLGQKKKVKGILCFVKLEPESVILPHEKTIPDKIQNHLALLKQTGCQFSPICSLYEDDGRKTMSRIALLSVGKPRVEFCENGIFHRLWIVNDILAIAAIRDDFSKRRLFLIDGHHRYRAAAEWKNQGGPDFSLMFLMDTEQDITLIPSHCLIHALQEWDETEFLTACQPYFQVIPRGTTDEIPINLDALYRQGKKAFAFYSGGANWTLLILKDIDIMSRLLPESSQSFRELDTSILHRLVLERLLGLPPAQGMEEKTSLSFIFSAEEVLSSVKNGSARLAFFLNPPRRKEILEISETGEKMPPKSTAVYPSIPTGMGMNLIKKEE